MATLLKRTAQLVRALRYVNFNNTLSFSVETYSHSPYNDIPEQFEMIPRADFEKIGFFSFDFDGGGE